jgi:Sec-independent protein secretion pathway component TatC
MYKGIFASSSDPTEISNRVRGAILASSGLIIFGAAHLFNITLTPDDILELASQASVVAGALWSIYGVGIWLVNLFGKK